MKKLGVDIDGVLNNFHTAVSKVIKKQFHKDVDPTNYDLFKGIQISDSGRKAFLKDHMEQINEETQLEWRVVEYLSRIQREYEICIITARSYDIAKETIEWLNNNAIPYDDVYFNSGEKIDVCQWLNTEWMIDDSPWNIRKLNKNKIKCMVFDQPYNSTVKETEYTTRVSSWQEIYEILFHINNHVNN